MNICFLNDLVVIEIPDLLELAVNARRLYSFHYINGRGFIEGKEKVGPGRIREMVPDSHGLKPCLWGQQGVYLNLEKGLLFCCSVVCQSRTGGGTLFTFLTGRPRDGVTRQSLKLEWLEGLQK